MTSVPPSTPARSAARSGPARLRGRKLSRLVVAPAAAAVCGSALLVPGAGVAAARWQTYCPNAEPLVSAATWHNHRLANGVRLVEGQASDRDGIVDMHVLSVDLTQANVRFSPLLRHVAQRVELSKLASGKPHLVAATNTGYFDFQSGAPNAPVIAGGRPITAKAEHQTVIGINTKHRLQSDKVWLNGSMTVGTFTEPLVGFNTRNPAKGLSLYTPRWGSFPVALHWNSLSRYVVNGKIASGLGQFDTVRTDGSLVVATGSAAIGYLRSLKIGQKVTYAIKTGTKATLPFSQAYGVGVQLVYQAGVVRTDLLCRASYPMPARNAVGFANHGRRLIIAVVTDHPGTKVHGLDNKQMSGLMVQLGASRAWAFDGSGSAELIARMPGTSKLAIRNYPADGAERPMPVGFGVSSTT